MEEAGVRDRSRMGALLMGLLVLAVFGVAFGANMWKRDLRVHEVRTQGNKIVTTPEILALAGIQKNQKLFDVDLGAARRRVQANQFVRSAAVSRDVPGRITIAVDERSPIAALAADRLLLVDSEGFVLPAARSEYAYDLPVLTGSLPAAECVPGRKIGAPAVREALGLLRAARTISDDFYRSISEVHVEGDRTIILYTADAGVPVIVGRGDIARKLVKLDAFWKEIVSRRGDHELQYVDLRFDDQVVVRWKEGNEQQTQ